MTIPVLRPTDIFPCHQLSLPHGMPAFGLDSCQLATKTFPQTKQTGPKPQPANDFTRFTHSLAGEVQLRYTGFPHMQIMDMRWQTGMDFELYDPTAFDAVTINFMVEGVMDSRMKGLPQSLPMKAGTHNLVRTSEAGHVNRIKGNQFLSMVFISLDKDFFASSIDPNDAWSEQVLEDLQHGRPFVGGQHSPSITPPMMSLIESIRNCQSVGPMRNLLIQSRVLELVALELEQFRLVPENSKTTPADEVEKLLQLKAYLEANFLEEHSLDHLSRFCGLNEFKVKKGFKQLFKTSVFAYLRKLRMEYAGQLLRNSAISVDEVADKLGYQYSQHFSIAFKKYMGITPSQYQHGR